MKKLYTNDIQRLYRVISSIANLKQLNMDIFAYGGQMSVLKDELASILSKSTNVDTSQSKMDRVFMIILLLNLGPDFENIREQILTGAVIPNFDEALARLLRHTSTATQSMRSKITPDTSVMVYQSHSRSDSRGGRSNVSACFTHSSTPWTLNTRASNHISGNKDLFFSLTFLSPLPTITLGSACPLPSLPLL